MSKGFPASPPRAAAAEGNPVSGVPGEEGRAPSGPSSYADPLGPPARARKSEATARIQVARGGIFAVEEFVDGLSFVRPSERSRLKLACSEIFDNLAKHASPLSGGLAIVRIARRGRVLFAAFYFKSPSFAIYSSRCVDHEPIFDRSARRWHGMGLRMTRNLSSTLRFRSGEICDRIFIRF